MASEQNNTFEGYGKERFTVVSYQRVLHQRAALLVPPILPRVMEEGESKKAALILMKNSHFDRTLRYSDTSFKEITVHVFFSDSESKSGSE